MEPEILNSQEIKSHCNYKTLHIYQLLNMFRKFEKVSNRWIEPYTYERLGGSVNTTYTIVKAAKLL